MIFIQLHYHNQTVTVQHKPGSDRQVHFIRHYTESECYTQNITNGNNRHFLTVNLVSLKVEVLLLMVGIFSSLLWEMSSSTRLLTLNVLGGIPLSVNLLWASLTNCSLGYIVREFTGILLCR